jgi:hypothetical protein
MSPSFDTTLPDDAVIRGEFDNSYLVEADGELQYVARSTAFDLTYRHDYGPLVRGDPDAEPVVFGGDPPMTVETTRGPRTFTLRRGDDRPVRTSPTEYERTLDAVLAAVEHDAPKALAALYEELHEETVDPTRVNQLQRQYAPVPPASVDITDEGWRIEDLFLLTWRGRVYLVTRQFDEPTFSVGGGIRRTDDDIEFIGLRLNTDDTDDDVLPNGERISAREVAFLARAKWLVEYRTRFDDDLFWDLIEAHVQSQRHAPRHYNTADQ